MIIFQQLFGGECGKSEADGEGRVVREGTDCAEAVADLEDMGF